MRRSVSKELLEEFSLFVAERMGLHFPKERWRELEHGIQAASRELSFPTPEIYLQWLLQSPLQKNQIEILASHLTVGETYFFREKRSFEILEEKIVPELIQARQGDEKRLRIWSAGCATGEEPYSIAILLSRAIPDWQHWNITLLATDINPAFLQKAREGIYTEWSFRDCPPSIKENYFQKRKGNRFEIFPSIREKVQFAYLNLAEDLFPSLLNNTNAIDLIFCRNVLMYFVPERAKKVIRSFYDSLVEGGWLIVSPTEVSTAMIPPFSAVSFSGATFYQKERREVAKLEVPVETLPSEEEAVLVPPQTKPQAKPVLPDAAAMTLLARNHANRGELAQALQWCQKAVQADKLNAGAHYLMATILQEQGEMAKAILFLRKVLYLDPAFVLAHFALGNLALRQEKYKEAEKCFENALALLIKMPRDEILKESEGMSAGRLIEIIQSTLVKEAAAS